MEKLIINNKSELPMEQVLEIAQAIVRQGRMSNNGKQYCYLTSFVIDNVEYHATSDLNKCSDTLTIYEVTK
jgi:hypothetical protein